MIAPYGGFFIDELYNPDGGFFIETGREILKHFEPETALMEHWGPDG